MARKPVVVVTGASKGIGLAVTRLLLTEFEAIVVALSRTRSPELLELRASHSSALLSVECDVTDAANLTEAIGLAVKTYTHIDGLILNAGVLEPMGRIGDTSISLDEWKSHFDVNFFSLITALRAALPALRQSEVGGRVVFVSSGAAVGGTAGWGPYNASKAAMNSLCRTLAQEEPDVISVALRPGMVDTNMQALIRDRGVSSLTEKDYQKFSLAHAEGKLVKPEDSGHVIAALVLKAPKSLSGQFVSWDSEDCKEFRRK
ncbi:short-chain dehydrogenase [Panus rudis PR-1116 ss-1]|nr:short-chain dehydrogenase [Panus rudis PR-1116 ss-1]